MWKSVEVDPPENHKMVMATNGGGVIRMVRGDQALDFVYWAETPKTPEYRLKEKSNQISGTYVGNGCVERDGEFITFPRSCIPEDTKYGDVVKITVDRIAT